MPIRKTAYQVRLEQENACLRILLRAVKGAVPADLRAKIEAYINAEELRLADFKALYRAKSREDRRV